MVLDAESRRAGFDRLAQAAEGDPLAMASMARLFRTDGWKAQSVELATRALAMAPADGEAHAIAREVLSSDVPAWHFAIVKDQQRNTAYAEALARVVTPGCRVLEVGTGTGLLAMMAARAGAGHVFTCEMEPAVAAAARDVIARNGLSERVTVLAKHSRLVTVQDIGGRADVLVSEIVSNDMVTQDALPALEDVIERLVVKGGTVVPARGRVQIALAHDAMMEARKLGRVDGFDLSPFDRLARPSYQIGVGSPFVELRSDAVTLFDFDFQSGGPWPAQRSRRTVSARGGPINGVVQWIALDMDGVGHYENRLGPAASSCWAALFHPFVNTVQSLDGDPYTLHGHQDRAALRVWSECLAPLRAG